MKSYTDLEQSKKLAEILPLESADMFYKYALPKSDKIIHTPEIGNLIDSLKWYNEGYTFRGKREPITLSEYCVPCWSLAALLKILAKIANKIDDDGSADLSSFMGKWSVNMFDCPIEVTDNYDNPIDACVAMIEKLYELKML